MENLSELATIYPNVNILHFHVEVKNNRLDFKVVHVACFIFTFSPDIVAFLEDSYLL